MFNQTKPSFRHRHNGDGVISSICSECLMSVATARIEQGLTQREISHVCDPVRLYQVWADPGSRLSSHAKPRWP
jgi:hypothetical protein